MLRSKLIRIYIYIYIERFQESVYRFCIGWKLSLPGHLVTRLARLEIPRVTVPAFLLPLSSSTKRRDASSGIDVGTVGMTETQRKEEEDKKKEREGRAGAQCSSAGQ